MDIRARAVSGVDHPGRTLLHSFHPLSVRHLRGPLRGGVTTPQLLTHHQQASRLLSHRHHLDLVSSHQVRVISDFRKLFCQMTLKLVKTLAVTGSICRINRQQTKFQKANLKLDISSLCQQFFEYVFDTRHANVTLSNVAF